MTFIKNTRVPIKHIENSQKYTLNCNKKDLHLNLLNCAVGIYNKLKNKQYLKEKKK